MLDGWNREPSAARGLQPEATDALINENLLFQHLFNTDCLEIQRF